MTREYARVKGHSAQISNGKSAFELWTVPFVLPPGHRCRAMRCALCGMMIGGRQVRLLTTVALQQAECEGNHLLTNAVLICGEHKPDGTGRISRLVLEASTDCDGSKVTR